jgi:IS1 family transposase
MIIKLNNEGVGISGIARLTGMSKANVVGKIKRMSGKALPEELVENGQEYEMDEVQTFIGKKENRCYLIYAINKRTKRVVDFVIGARTKENLDKIISKIKKLNPKSIFTDKLNLYPSLIEKGVHVSSVYKINHIERFNLTLRTHLKRLNRKTICFSKSPDMLAACLKLYLFL